MVAGGRDRNGRDLDVVEVLANSHWEAVDPLPTLASVMHAKVHEGRIYFLVQWEGRMDVALYSCSSDTLLTSHKDSKG